MFDAAVAKKTADTVRILAAEAVQKAKSGHPGMPMGVADFAVTLWSKYLKFNPQNTDWMFRDRFILSAGHGSMLIYALLHLFECGLSIEELENFRQWGSLTPGHPEYGHTKGVDITTGPLGSGLASAVGMAIGAKYFQAKTDLDKEEFAKHKIYVIAGDGCMMEGATSEASSLAGHLKLDNLIVFYDDNSITIEGATSLAFSEDVAKRYEAYNWRVIHIADANDIAQCDQALAEAQKSDGRPTLLVGKTQIAFGAPTKVGKSSAHGEPLGEEETASLRRIFDLPGAPFEVAKEVRDFCHSIASDQIRSAAAIDQQFNTFLAADKARANIVSAYLTQSIPADLGKALMESVTLDKPVAGRASGGEALQKAAELIPALLGGAADLAPSTKTDIKGAGDFSAGNRTGRNLHFGVRELAMGFIANGLAAYGTAIPYSSTFFVFSDYMKPAIRLAALMKLKQIYIFTHDSYQVGEDGPTHEPIEQLAMLRTIPGVTVFRPAEAHEVAQSWACALRCEGPSALLLSRQNLTPFDEKTARKVEVAKGAYIVDEDENFDLILIATGSEVALALETADALRALECKVRVVSMPSQELFLQQDEQYQQQILPDWCGVRVTIEAGSTYGWEKFATSDGLMIGLDHFGASAPGNVLAEKFGFTRDAVIARIAEHFIYEADDCDCGCGCEEEDCNCDGECR